MAQGRSLGDPETIHFGLVPRAHRGIMAINELPDLAERIQVALLNVMEERDIQVRGYTLRLPLDVLLVATANPEDYTNRGRIITPLKDRFGAEIRTHYPLELVDEIAVIPRRPNWRRPSPTTCWRSSPGSPGCCASRPRWTRAAGCQHGSPSPPPRPSRRRPSVDAAITGEAPRPHGRSTWSRRCRCCAGNWSSSPGRKVARTRSWSTCSGGATADTARGRLRGVDLTPLVEAVTRAPLRTGDRVTAAQVVAALPRVAVLAAVGQRLGAGGTEDPGPMASAAELALELLFLTRKLTKEASDDGETVSYG